MVDVGGGARVGGTMADLFRGTLQAWCDLLALGAAAVDIAAASGELDELSGPFDLYAEPVLRAAASFGDFGKSALGAAAGTGGLAEAAAESAAMAEDLAPIVVEVYLAGGRGALRYWRRLAATFAAHRSTFLQMLELRLGGPPLTEEQQRRACDELRVFLRGVGEDAVLEARIFQSELDDLAAAVAEAVGAGGGAEYRRRWKAKA